MRWKILIISIIWESEYRQQDLAIKRDESLGNDGGGITIGDLMDALLVSGNSTYTPDFSQFDFTQFGAENGSFDCPKCPKEAKDGQIFSIGFTGYQYRDGNWIELEVGKVITYKGKNYLNPSVEPITGDVPLGPGGVFKGPGF